MIYLLDTSIVLRLNESGSPVAESVEQCLEKLIRDNTELVLVPQILVEFWAVATRPKAVNGLGFTTAEAELKLADLQAAFQLLAENERIFDEWRKIVAQYGVSGKTTHDARIVAAMQIHKIENILTLNPNDFKRYTNVSAVTPQKILSK